MLHDNYKLKNYQINTNINWEVINYNDVGFPDFGKYTHNIGRPHIYS